LQGCARSIRKELWDKEHARKSWRKRVDLHDFTSELADEKLKTC
jgi:hypothetical protein